MHESDRARLIIQLYLIGIPVWWALGFDFLALQGFALLLVLAHPGAMRHFTAGDHLLLALIVTLGVSAYLNGFLIEQHPTRFMAALYNLSFWICGFVLILQVRQIVATSERGRLALLRSGLITFVILVATGWGCFALAYAIGELSLITPSFMGLLVGDRIPDSAPHIQRHAWLVFTLVDWGLPGVPMPRVRVFGPYPTAAAVTAAVLGALSLLYLNTRRPTARLLPLIFEAVILITVAMTLTRSVLGGWVLGALVANLLFGDAFRRFAATFGAVLLVGFMALGALDLTHATEYREYSSESRFDSYMNAIEQTIESNPILGLGIKPREESHIAVGSHSTIVSAFTKGGVVGVTLALLFLFLRPAVRWTAVCLAFLRAPSRAGPARKAELRILLNLQIALWVWLCFEDVDAPATAAALIFIAICFIERATGRAVPAAEAMSLGTTASARGSNPAASRAAL